MTKLMQITQFYFCHSGQLITDYSCFFDDLLLQIIESISPKASVENSSSQLVDYFSSKYECRFIPKVSNKLTTRGVASVESGLSDPTVKVGCCTVLCLKPIHFYLPVFS